MPSILRPRNLWRCFGASTSPTSVRAAWWLTSLRPLRIIYTSTGWRLGRNRPLQILCYTPFPASVSICRSHVILEATLTHCIFIMFFWLKVKSSFMAWGMVCLLKEKCEFCNVIIGLKWPWIFNLYSRSCGFICRVVGRFYTLEKWDVENMFLINWTFLIRDRQSVWTKSFYRTRGETENYSVSKIYNRF